MNSSGDKSDSYTLLTGATGVIGEHLLRNLLGSQLPVAVLVRSSGSASGHGRIETLMQRLENKFGRCFARPVVIEGNLRSNGLGLSTTDEEWVAGHCSRVLHSAANLTFAPAETDPENEPFSTNVDGTANLLQVCGRAKIAEFHYVSTAYVCGLQNGTVTENQRCIDQQFANDYECSKARTETLLNECSDIRSLTVYRPSIVVDPTADTAIKSDQAISTAFSTYQLLAARFGLPESGAWLKNLGLTGSERKNIVSAAWVARTIVQILRRSMLHGTTYHLTSPVGTTVQSLEDGFRKAVENSKSHAKKSTLKKLAPRNTNGLLDKLAAPYVATFLPYFRDDPKFDQSNLSEALSACDEMPCPPIAADEICHLATVQMATSVSARKAPEQSAETLSSLLSELETAASNPRPELDRDGVGIVLSGPSAGSWTVSTFGHRTVQITRGITPGVHRRLYSSLPAFDELLRNSATLDEALVRGKLLIETDSAEDDHSWVKHTLQSLHNVLLVSEDRTSAYGEVIHAR